MAAPEAAVAPARLTLVRLDIDTYREFVIYMNRDCPVCRSEGFVVRSRIDVRLGGRHIVATLNAVGPELLAEDQAGLSESAWSKAAAVVWLQTATAIRITPSVMTRRPGAVSACRRHTAKTTCGISPSNTLLTGTV